jgi:hypothetical protein
MTRLRSDDAHDSWEISIPSGSIGSLSQSFLALGLTCHCRPKLSCQLQSESREIVLKQRRVFGARNKSQEIIIAGDAKFLDLPRE